MTASKERPTDAIALLKADHRLVEELFDKFEKARSSEVKQKLAHQICMELSVHTMIEEELFYPLFRGDGVEDDDLDEAYVEHDGAKVLIAEIMAASPDDDFYDAKVKVLSEDIIHHVKEEERPGEGIFAQARHNSDVDFNELGARLLARKEELKAQFEEEGIPTPETRTLSGAKLTYGQPVEMNA